MQPSPTSKTDSPGPQTSTLKGHSTPRFPLWHRLFRLVWNIVWWLFASWTPPQLNRWRRFLLSAFGAKLARGTVVRGGARVWYPPNLEMHEGSLLADGVNCYNMGRIVIGERSIVSQNAHLCGGTHDFTRASRPLLTKPIVIGDDVWIAAEAFIGPGVTVPDGCVIGARAVVSSRLEPWTVYAGNPAKPVKRRDFDPRS
ncbi:MAG: putative colanic acid biosynthesis acetyltransferase [Confluentimicrobium sp.]|mgnify:CR=1 FL=1|jgi:putative colanic acid biosynthesis acetyltransferase WcaF|nr:putative colanic acid biosynthesis acetyltransferase [Actibacterium sp.]|tara:strand:+ start:3252 stop:3848 length:597 start_codon:yes stop_codon:yes gene_type:complete